MVMKTSDMAEKASHDIIPTKDKKNV